MQFRKDGDEDDFRLEMTPLIDVVFLLLIFFMVSTAFVDFSRRMDISLPESKSSIPDEAPK
ncbi:MAG: ExbD/TolR family protein, partial [Nitrospinales bacterium]